MSHSVNWNRQLILAISLFTLGMGAYWLEYKHKPEKESSEQQGKKVFQIKDNQIRSVSLYTGNQPTVITCSDFAAQLCKPGDNSKWEISEPSKFKADDSNVSSFISTLNTLVPSETIDLKDETPEKRQSLLKEYGLDAEIRKFSRRVKVLTSQGETTLYLGLNHPIGDALFTLIETGQGKGPDENKVYLIPNFFRSNLEHDLTYWRDKKLFTLNSHEVNSFQLSGSKEKISGERKEGLWNLHLGAEEFAGDSENVEALLSSATSLTAKSFASDSKSSDKGKAALKGASPTLTLSLQKEKDPILLTLFQKKGTGKDIQLLATVSNLDPVFELDSSAKDRLDKGSKDLRLNKLILSMDRFSAKKIEFSGTPMGKTPLSLTQTNGKWILAGASEKDQEHIQQKVNGIFEKLSGNRIHDFVKGAAIPQGEKDGLKISLGDEKNPAKRQLVFWKDKGKLYARDLLSKRQEAFVVEPSIQEGLPWTADFFKFTETKAPKSVDTHKE